MNHVVIPAQAGIQNGLIWTLAFPVFMGMTGGVTGSPGGHQSEKHPVRVARVYLRPHLNALHRESVDGEGVNTSIAKPGILG